MVVIENLVIIALTGLAFGYLIKLVWDQFSSKNTGCASCAGSCDSILKETESVPFPNVKKNYKGE